MVAVGVRLVAVAVAGAGAVAVVVAVAGAGAVESIVVMKTRRTINLPQQQISTNSKTSFYKMDKGQREEI